jgi:hypothetical protein
MAEWRVGGKLKRTLYRDDQLVGLVDTGEIAAEIVEALNAQNGTLPGDRPLTLTERGMAEWWAKRRREMAAEGGRERSLAGPVVVGETGPEPHQLCGTCGRLTPLDGGGLFMPHTVVGDDPTADWCEMSRRRP